MSTSAEGASITRAIWAVVILSAFWAYHFRTAAVDRATVGETGVSATLRRWYAYPLTFLGLAFLLFGARNLLQQIWVLLVEHDQVIVAGGLVPTALATMLTGLLIWGFHSQWTARPPVAADDQASTLRAVEGFLALAGSVALALFGASQLLYYVLARILGIENPGGISSGIVVALASPVATIIVFGLAWLWIRQQLASDAGQTEARRQAGVRHLYTHLVALLALATLAVGVGGLLWTLSDQLLFRMANQVAGAGEWRDKTSLFVTLIIVGVPMWLSHWRQSTGPTERYTLSRRLYLYATLLASVLAVLISGAIFIYRLLTLVLGSSYRGGAPITVDMGRALSVVVVAAAIGLYHWRVLRSDGGTHPVVVPEPLAGPEIQVAITGATEQEIRRALADLPDSASFTIRK